MVGGINLGRKEREGKKIRREGTYFSCLVVKKNWEEKIEVSKFCGLYMNSAKILCLCYWVENYREKGGFFLFPFLPSFPKWRERRGDDERGEGLGCTKSLKVLHDSFPLLSLFF